MNKLIFPRMAFQNIKRGYRIYLPYILTIIGCTGGFYIVTALARDPGVAEMRGAEYVRSMLFLGSYIVAFFAALFLLYTNSFLIKRRKNELGLYAVLGMGKKHIALLLTIETLIISVCGIVLGLLFGMLLYKLALLLLCRMLTFPIPFGFYIDVDTICGTTLLFALIMAATLVGNLWSVWRMNTVQLLQGSSTGEKEPKVRFFYTLLGLVSLSAGYYIAMTVTSAVEAISFYFLAVFLVIVGTYCLFTSISIFVMKLLRKNKSFYYKSRNFITLSGMLYRMKRNAVGLSNICILSTMVLVMISGTVSLYLGTEAGLDLRYPADINLYSRHYPASDTSFDGPGSAQALRAAAEEQGFEIDGIKQKKFLSIGSGHTGDGHFTTDTGNYMVADTLSLCFLSYDDVADFLSMEIDRPQPGHAYYRIEGMSMPNQITVDFGQGGVYTWDIDPLDDRGISVGDFSGYIMDTCYIILPDDQSFYEIYQAQTLAYGDNRSRLGWEALISVANKEDEAACAQYLFDSVPQMLSSLYPDTDFSLSVRSRQSNSREVYAMNGGFLFLGILLGTIFIMGAVLIIYYKQVSEGHDDRGRYQIMQQVGLSKKEVKSSIRAQILAVFFLPLIVAALHVLFDFRIMLLLLRLFNIYNWQLTALCTVGTFAVFAIIYCLVYTLTARTYYKIVS